MLPRRPGTLPASPLQAAPTPRPGAAIEPATPPIALTLTLPASAPDAAPRPAPPASAPLVIDQRVIRAAGRESRSDVRRMADTSGAYVGDDPATSNERLSTAIERTGKPDCLGPNAGGSLLSAPIIMYQAVTGQCR